MFSVRGMGGGRQRQHVYLPGHLLELFLVGHAEALFLVNDQQPQVLEFHALLQQAVGADQKIHGPRFQVLEDLSARLGRLEAAEHRDIHRERAEAVHRRGIVLLGQDRGGHQDSRLLPVEDALHHRPQGHFGLAVAHVAAQQAVHGHWALHIALDLPNAAQLVLGLLIGKGLLEFQLPGGIRRKGKAPLFLPFGVQLDQALGQILGRRLGPAGAAGPVRAAQLVQAHRFLVLSAADVFAHQVQLGSRHIETVAAGIGDLDIVPVRAVHRHFEDAHEAAHAVVDVDHQIAGGQIGIGLKLLAVRFCAARPGLFLLRRQKLPLRQHRQRDLSVFDARRQRPQGDLRRAGGGQRFHVEIQRRGDAAHLQDALKILRAPLAAAQHQHPEALLQILLHIRRRGLQTAAVGGELLGVQLQQALRRQGIAGGGQGVQKIQRPLPQIFPQFFRPDGELGPFARQGPRFQGAFHVLPGPPQIVFQPLRHPGTIADADSAVRRQIGRRRDGFPPDGRGVAVQAAVERVLPQKLRVPLQGLQQLLPGALFLFQFGAQGVQLSGQPRRAALSHLREHLVRRQQQHTFHIFRAPLARRVKGTHGVHFVAEKLHAHGDAMPGPNTSRMPPRRANWPGPSTCSQRL